MIRNEFCNLFHLKLQNWSCFDEVMKNFRMEFSLSNGFIFGVVVRAGEFQWVWVRN